MRFAALWFGLLGCSGPVFHGMGGAGGNGGSGGAGGSPGIPLPPGDPGPADVRIDVDSGAGVHAISPWIYGTNQPDWNGKSRYLTLARAGGNRLTAYNWENNASNAGTDYLNQNDAFLGGGDTPGEAMRAPIAAALAARASFIQTIPIAGYVAADKLGGGDVNQTANYLQTRFRVDVAQKGAAFAYPPDASDANVYQDEFVAWLESTFPGAHAGDPAHTIFYELDNEPDLWSSTHPRIHPTPVTYAELVQRDTDFARAIKAVAPAAMVLGPVSYGWAGYVSLQGAPDGAGRDFLDVYLDAMRAAEASAGRRLVDVLDLHWYPEAQGAGVRIIGADATAAVATARVQAPRSLWDDGYVESSWITQDSTGGPIRLLPRMRDKIAAHYPGTAVAITEYNYGGGGDISGGVAQADVLGIFGRESLFAATLWELASDESYIYGGFAMFRNYDGAGGRFGDTSIAAASSDITRATAYASVDAAAADRMVVVAINKTTGSLRAGLAVTHTVRFGHAEAYQLVQGAPAPARIADVAAVAQNAFAVTLPAMSVITLVLKP